MKKLLFFINTLDGGGAEKVLVNLVNTIDAAQYAVDLVTVTGGVHADKLSEKIHFRRIVHSKNQRLAKLLEKIVYHIPFTLFARLFLRGQYDAEIAYLEGFPTRVIAAKNSAAIKIAFVHCDVSVQPVLQPFYKTEQACLAEYRQFDKVCFVSEVARNGFEKTFGTLEHAQIIHNIVCTSEILQKSKEQSPYHYETDGLKILAVGRLSAEKGYDRLVRAAAHLENKYAFELWIAGEGGERTALENLIQKLGAQSVKLLGFQENPYSLMRQADLFVCPSYYEGYSTVVTEAVVLGVPVLTTDCAGMREILDNGHSGCIVENSDEALEHGLEILLQNRAQYQNLKSVAQQKSQAFSTAAIMQEYIDLFKELGL